MYWSHLDKNVPRLALRSLEKGNRIWVGVCGLDFFCSAFISYTLMRVYIVVESFISLRHVPIGVYAALLWALGIPHVWKPIQIKGTDHERVPSTEEA